MNNPKEMIEEFLKDRNKDDRYSSFDYCYGYFYSFYRNNEIIKIADEKNIEISCLQL
jgi:hypothetical protein